MFDRISNHSSDNHSGIWDFDICSQNIGKTQLFCPNVLPHLFDFIIFTSCCWFHRTILHCHWWQVPCSSPGVCLSFCFSLGVFMLSPFEVQQSKSIHPSLIPYPISAFFPLVVMFVGKMQSWEFSTSTTTCGKTNFIVYHLQMPNLLLDHLGRKLPLTLQRPQPQPSTEKRMDLEREEEMNNG